MNFPEVLARVLAAVRPAALYAALVLATALATGPGQSGVVTWGAVGSAVMLAAVLVGTATAAYAISPRRGGLILWGLTVLRLAALVLWVDQAFGVDLLREGVYQLQMFFRWTVLAAPLIAVALLGRRRRATGEWLAILGLAGSWMILLAGSWPFLDYPLDVCCPPDELRYDLFGALGWFAVLIWPFVMGLWLYLDATPSAAVAQARTTATDRQDG